MQTLDIKEAAEFLKMSREGLRQLAASGKVPGRKAGKRWVFVKEHLADWISDRYPECGQIASANDGNKKQDNHLLLHTKDAKRGRSSLSNQAEDEYKRLLGLK